jgi:hypothetical protein
VVKIVDISKELASSFRVEVEHCVEMEKMFKPFGRTCYLL